MHKMAISIGGGILVGAIIVMGVLLLFKFRLEDPSHALGLALFYLGVATLCAKIFSLKSG